MARYCLRCKTTENISLHHLLPRAHFKGSRGTAPLCLDCHKKLEVAIQMIEGKDKNHKRVKLPEEYYFLIFDMFIKKL